MTYQRISKNTYLVPYLVKGDVYKNYRVMYPIFSKRRLDETRSFYLSEDNEYSILYMTTFMSEKEIEKRWSMEIDIYG